MIKINKSNEPQLLKDNKIRWTNDLLNLVKKYGSYNAIPKREKEAAIKYYAHPDIQTALLGGQAKAKCVYCESYVNATGYANIEHYKPKSLYPELTFEWDNLFVGCTLCNIPKNNFDTGKEPFIHPTYDDPEDYLTFEDMIYYPKDSTGLAYQKANNLIKECKLDRIVLVRKHADIQCQFMSNKQMLIEKMNHYNGLKTEPARYQDAADILSSLTVLNSEASDDAEYAGYMRYLLRKSKEVKEAVTIVNNHKDDLDIPSGFIWSFKY